jgi:hypothetical protein
VRVEEFLARRARCQVALALDDQIEAEQSPSTGEHAKNPPSNKCTSAWSPHGTPRKRVVSASLSSHGTARPHAEIFRDARAHSVRADRERRTQLERRTVAPRGTQADDSTVVIAKDFARARAVEELDAARAQRRVEQHVVEALAPHRVAVVERRERVSERSVAAADARRGPEETHPADPARAELDHGIAHAKSSSIGRHSGLMNSPHALKRGKCCGSTSATRKPSRASRSASEEPAGPAPAIATS